ANLAESYISRLENDYVQVLKDSTLIGRLLVKKESLKEFEQLTAKQYGIYLYSVNLFGDTEMRFWSNESVLPPDNLLEPSDGKFYLPLLNGTYYGIRKVMPGILPEHQVIIFVMIPIQSEFFIESDYLPKKFFFSNTADKTVQISNHPTEFPVKNSEGTILFY